MFRLNSDSVTTHFSMQKIASGNTKNPINLQYLIKIKKYCLVVKCIDLNNHKCVKFIIKL